MNALLSMDWLKTFITGRNRVKFIETIGLFQAPRYTTAEITAIKEPKIGMIAFDTDINKLKVYTGGWETITSV